MRWFSLSAVVIVFVLAVFIPAYASADIIPSGRLANWTPGVTVGVPGGIPNRTVICATVTGSGGSMQTIVGSISAGSNQLVVVSLADFSVGQGIVVPNARLLWGSYQTNLNTAITAINGNIITLNDNADITVSDVAVGHNDASTIQTAIDNCPANEVVYLSAGIYLANSQIGLGAKKNITIRGAGMDKTIIECNHGGSCTGTSEAAYNSGFYSDIGEKIVSGAFKGSNTIQVADGSQYTVGHIVRISTAENYSLPVTSVSGPGYNPRQQKSMIIGINGNNLTISPAVITDLLANASYVKQTTQDFASYDGFEDLTIDGLDLATTGISFDTSYASWIKNVKIENITNYDFGIGDSLQCEVRESYLNEINVISSNHGGLLMGASTGCLVEDNIMFRIFPIMEINGGSTGNVFAYNFYAGGMVDTNHGPHNSYNLYEGNAFENVMSDGYYGSESEGTFFRNWIRGTTPDDNGNLAASGWTIALKRFSRNFNIVGNIIGTTGIQNGTYSFGGPNLGNGAYGYGPNNNGFSNLGYGTSHDTVQPSNGIYWLDWLPVTGYGIRGILTTRTSDYGGVVTITDSSNSNRLYDYMHTLCYGIDIATDPTLTGCADSLGLDWGTGSRGTMSQSLNLTDNTFTFDGGYTDGKILPSVGTAIGVWPRSEGFQELDLDVQATTLLKGNWLANSTGGAIPANESLGGQTLPNSLYLTGKPSWFGNLTWPPFDPTNPNPSNDSIPAGYRYVHGTDPTGVTSTNYNPADLNGDMVVSSFESLNYTLYYKRQLTWPVAPSPIDAANWLFQRLLFKRGGSYTIIGSGCPPSGPNACWNVT